MKANALYYNVVMHLQWLIFVALMINLIDLKIV